MDRQPAQMNEQARKNLEASATNSVRRARMGMIMENSARGAFFSSLAMRMKLVPCWTVPYTATDGDCFRYNPEWLVQLDGDEIMGVLAKAVLACALQHHTRMAHRDPAKWSVASSLATNEILSDAEYKILNGDFTVGKKPFTKWPENETAELYYSKLPDTGSNGGMGGGKSVFSQAPVHIQQPEDSAERERQKQEWEVNAGAAAAAAKERGDIPGALERLLGKLAEPKIDWKAELREFVSRHVPRDLDWCRPNRRYLHQGLFFPTLTGEAMEHIAVAIDTSGSIGDDVLAVFASELTGILGQSPSKLSVIWCDCQIHRVDEYDLAQSELDLNLKPVGGGGTDHVPVFKWLDKCEDPPACLINLTDLVTSFPAEGPDIPVLWCVYGNKSGKAPFGKTIHINEGDL